MWRDDYRVREVVFRDWGCSVCRKLNEDFRGQVYMDMDSLWPQNMCTNRPSGEKGTRRDTQHGNAGSKWMLY